MKYRIHNMSEPFVFYENKKKISLNGYAFLDEFGKCFIIVYGEGRKNTLKKYLEDPADELHVKYQYVDLEKS